MRIKTPFSPRLPWLAIGAAAMMASISLSSAVVSSTAETRPATGAQIPLVPGLVIVGVVTERDGDREPVLTIQSVESDFYEAHFSTEVDDSNSGKKRTLTVLRRVRMQDHRNARAIRSEFWERDPVTFAGTTPFLSRAIVEDLRRGSSTITNHYSESFFGLPVAKRHRGSLKRVAFEKYAVLVNGRLTELSVIRARGTLQGDDGEAPEPVDVLALDDLDNPLFLSWKDFKGDARIVRIDYPEPTVARARLESALAKKKPVDVYNIYFAFASSSLRPQSKPTLDDIAAVLAKNADWKIHVHGHTDNIGDDATNLQLSQQRAQAVRDALIRDYRVAPERITAAGSGEGGAIVPNDTPEGRARNRRVVLTRR